MSWRPAFDLNRTIGLAAAVAAVWLLAGRRRSARTGAGRAGNQLAEDDSPEWRPDL